MAKVAKHTLKLEDDFNYDLVGIYCPQSDYRLCWNINEALGLFLSKSDEPYMVSGKKSTVSSAHSFYEWYDKENQVNYYLIKNKDGVNFLIPEERQTDYFLVIQESGMVEINTLLMHLKQIPSILAASILNPNTLKSSKNLIF